MLTSIIPVVLTVAADIRSHLQEHGWAVTRVVDEPSALQMRSQILDELAMYPDEIPRTLGGMIKTHNMCMSRTAHEIRKLARPVFFDILRDAYDAFLVFPRPEQESDLSCNPDALFVSTGEPARFPRGVDIQDSLWWHVDTEQRTGFLQGSFVLDNPEGSEEFAVLDGSHHHFDELEITDHGTDFHLLTHEERTRLSEICQPLSLRVPPGCLVVWYSATVHTVRPPNPALYTRPRVQTYVCFGTTMHLDAEYIRDVTLTKALAVLLAGSCRHHPYPCEVTWQRGLEGATRDFLPVNELIPWIFGSRPTDFTDEELSVYGLSRASVLDAVDYWSTHWNRKMQQYTRFITNQE